MRSSEGRPKNQPVAWYEFPHIAFDIDGTLVDSNIAHVWSWQDAIEEENLFFPHFTLFAQMGLPGHQIAEKYGFALRDHKSAERITKRASEIYAQRYSKWVKPFDGAAKLLKTLRTRAHCRTYALTSSTELESRALLGRLGMDQYFDLILTAEVSGEGKPTAEPFARLRERIGPRAPLISVGDSPYDFRASHNAGVPFVFVGHGGFPREWFERVHTRFFNLGQMLQSLGQLKKGRRIAA